jgi:protocatechuate 3,4-dioxygenase beta subunit
MERRVNVRSRLKLLAGIGAVVAPLLFVWILCRSCERTLAPRRPVVERKTPAAAPPPAKPVEPLVLTGELVDGEGRPVAEAIVTLVDPDGRGDVLAPGRTRDFRDRESRTDSAGRFRFDDLSPGRRSLIARAGERAPAWTEPFLLDRNLHRALTLPAPVTVNGLSHPGAKLWFESRIPGMPVTGHEAFGRKVAADGTGAFKVDGLPPSVPFTVRVEATGYRTQSFGPYQFPSGRHFLDFDLQTGLTLRGTVGDRAGRPVAGAEAMFDGARAVADADGTFTLSGLEERISSLVVSREGYIQTVVHSVRPGSVEVTLPRAAEICGRVKDSRARYLCYTLGDARYRMGLGSSDTFRIPSVPPGPLRLDIEDADCRPLGSILVDAPEGGSVEDVEITAR